MRYANGRKESTRQAIIEAAGRRLKLDGVDGSGVTTLMNDAGLTNGAFYAHFSSKDELIASAIADQLAQQRATLRSVADDRDGVEAFVRRYLSAEHRDDRSNGCPSAALLNEVARCSDTVRAAYSSGVTAIIDDIAVVLDPDNRAPADGRTWNLIVSLIGTLQMARAIVDPYLSDAILQYGIDHAISLLGAITRVSHHDEE